MKKPIEPEKGRFTRDMLIGLGEASIRKSYYPELQARMAQLERFHFLLEQAHDAIFLVDANSRIIVDANGAARHTCQGQEQLVLGTAIDCWLISEGLSELLQAEKPEEVLSRHLQWQLQCPQGCTLPVELSASRVDLGEGIYLVLVARDITERLQAQAALEEAKAELEEKVELRTQELTALNQELQATNLELMRTIDELQKTQQHLAHSEKMAALGNLVAGVAHEINTPLGVGITLVSHLDQVTKELQERYQSGALRRQEFTAYLAETREAAGMLQTNLNRAAQLIRNFKQVSVDQSSEVRRRFFVKEYLDSILASLYAQIKKTKIRVTVECDEQLTLEGYPGALAQIVTNLVMNSLVHGYEPDRSGEIVVKGEVVEGQFVLTYADDGKGIDPEVLPRIFEPFFTTNRSGGGSGLGLYILYNLVTGRLGGTVDCHSQPGQGTAFRIEIPLHK